MAFYQNDGIEILTIFTILAINVVFISNNSYFNLKHVLLNDFLTIVLVYNYH